MFSSTSLRLAAAYTAAFALAVAILGGLTIVGVRAALSQQFDARIRTESEAVKIDYVTGGLPGLMRELAERRNNPGELDFGVQTPTGEPLDDAPEDGGCVEVVSATHRDGLATLLGGTIPADVVAAKAVEHRVTALPASAGEAMLIHNHLWHRSGLNRSGKPRRAFTVCYMSAATRCLR